MKLIRDILPIVLLFLTLVACNPEDDQYRLVDYETLYYRIGDNNNLSTYKSALDMTAVKDKLKAESRFIVLAPTNLAFAKNKLNSESIRTTSAAWLGGLANKYILETEFDLRNLPFNTTQRLFNLNDDPLYFCRFLKGKDTVLTVNGLVLDQWVVEGTNGKLYTMGDVLQLKEYKTVIDLIQDNASFTFFFEAIRQANMEAYLRALPNCSLFVPTNDAMQRAGYSSLSAIKSMEKNVLEKLVKRHLYLGKFFMGEIPWRAELSKDVGQNGSKLYYTNRLGQVSGFDESYAILGVYRGWLQLEMANGRNLLLQYSEGSDSVNKGFRIDLLDGSDNFEGIPQIDIAFRDQSANNGVVSGIDKVLKQ